VTPLFVDCHSHMLPSGDDGVSSVEEGVTLARQAASRGTRILFATPHVWPHLVLTEERERAVRAAHAEAAGKAGLELRLGWELTPTRRLLDDDPRRYILEGTDCVLVEVPFVGGGRILVDVAERIEAAGLRPVVAHPERTEVGQDDRGWVRSLAERGWTLHVNATSLLGRHGPECERIGWELLEEGTAQLVASDGHRQARPPFLDEAFRAARARLGDDAVRFFDGRALAISEAPAARAASR
jgi:protein-tyrosine phosphatase